MSFDYYLSNLAREVKLSRDMLLNEKNNIKAELHNLLNDTKKLIKDHNEHHSASLNKLNDSNFKLNKTERRILKLNETVNEKWNSIPHKTSNIQNGFTLNKPNELIFPKYIKSSEYNTPKLIVNSSSCPLPMDIRTEISHIIPNTNQLPNPHSSQPPNYNSLSQPRKLCMPKSCKLAQPSAINSSPNSFNNRSLEANKPIQQYHNYSNPGSQVKQLTDKYSQKSNQKFNNKNSNVYSQKKLSEGDERFKLIVKLKDFAQDRWISQDFKLLNYDFYLIAAYLNEEIIVTLCLSRSNTNIGKKWPIPFKMQLAFIENYDYNKCLQQVQFQPKEHPYLDIAGDIEINNSQIALPLSSDEFKVMVQSDGFFQISVTVIS